MGRLPVGVRAFLLMGGSVFLGSWFPLVVALVGASVGPVSFFVWVFLSVTVGTLVYIVVVCPPLFRRRDVWWRACTLLWSRDGLFAVLVPLNAVFFVWATLFVDTAVVTIVVAGYTLLFVKFREMHDRFSVRRRYKRVGITDWMLMFAALVGMGLVALSQAGELSIGGDLWRVPVGVFLSACSMVCASWVAYRYRLGESLYRGLFETGGVERGTRYELGCLLVVRVVANVVGLVFGVLVLFLGSGPVFSGDTVLLVVLGAVWTVDKVAARYANLVTSDLGINALVYLRPVLSLVWLSVFVEVGVSRVDWLIVGAVTVVVVNVLVGFRSAGRVV